MARIFELQGKEVGRLYTVIGLDPEKPRLRAAGILFLVN
jgi:hypothetical protein